MGNKEASWLDLKNSDKKSRDSQSTEVLFIEQCHQFLTEGGYLAIVLPDGVLTNSSLQYVRDQIENWYRIIAVVSLPQTAFTATGAGVKSSVMFLRKYSANQTESLKQLKLSLQNGLLNQYNYKTQSEALETQKQNALKNATGVSYAGSLSDFKKTEAYKTWRAETSAE